MCYTHHDERKRGYNSVVDNSFAADDMSLMRKRRRELRDLDSVHINVRVIINELLRILSGDPYVLINNVIGNDISTNSFIMSQEPEPIDFSNNPKDIRTQQVIDNGLTLLHDVVHAIHVVFPSCDRIVMKKLFSKANGVEQSMHTDHVHSYRAQRITALTKLHYSAIIANEENTTLMIGQNNGVSRQVNIPQYAMLFYRGDVFHADSLYKKDNSRIFMSISSKNYHETEEQGIIST